MKEKKVIQKLHKRESGFTLIELLVVIGIIAVLATIGTISFGNAASKSRDAKRQADLKTIASGLQISNTRMGQFPSTAVATTWAGFLGQLGVSGATPPRGGGENYCYYVRSGGTQSLNAFMLVATDFENDFPSDAYSDIALGSTTGIFEDWADTDTPDDTDGTADDFVVDSENFAGAAAAEKCRGRSGITDAPNCLGFGTTNPAGDGDDYCIIGTSTALF